MEQRIIKFRAWDGKKMIMPDYPFIGAGSSATEICIRIDGKTRIPNAYGLEGSTMGLPRPEIPELIFMQFTGLKDKNGTEIYEGDIIKLVDDSENEIIVVCEYGIARRANHRNDLIDIPSFYFKKTDGTKSFPMVNNYLGKHDLELFEVIGNIYTHPNLIQQHAH